MSEEVAEMPPAPSSTRTRDRRTSSTVSEAESAEYAVLPIPGSPASSFYSSSVQQSSSQVFTLEGDDNETSSSALDDATEAPGESSAARSDARGEDGVWLRSNGKHQSSDASPTRTSRGSVFDSLYTTAVKDTEQILGHAATVLQRVFRGFQGRKYVED